jgi:hypothetical protein
MKGRVCKIQYKLFRHNNQRNMELTKVRIKVSPRILHKSMENLMLSLNPSRKEEDHQTQKRKIKVISNAIVVKNGVTMLLSASQRRCRIVIMKLMQQKMTQMKAL